MESLINIFNYWDYRNYLRDWIDLKKSTRSGFSLRLMALKVGCDPSFIVRVLQRKKSLSSKLTIKLGNYMKLCTNEINYFELLVQMDKWKDPQEKSHILRKIFNVRMANQKVQSDSTVKTLNYENPNKEKMDASISSLTMGLSEESYEKLLETIINFRQECLKLENEGSRNNKLYHFNFEAFLVTA